MKLLYLDLNMGAAGDMLTGALLELLPDPKEALEALNSLQIPGIRYEAAPSVKCGITGTKVTVLVHGEEEDAGEAVQGHDHGHGHEHEHEHEHGHNHNHHHHTSMRDITELVSSLSMPEAVRQRVLRVYRSIADAESRAHGMPVEAVHFHEVGTMDAVADITGACYLIELISPDRVAASAVHTGFGQVHAAHGILPVPAPATAYLLEGIPSAAGQIEGELCTPTGAALLRELVTEFGPMPEMTVDKIGYGMGKKDFPAANCVRAMLGTAGEEIKDAVCELTCNLDDMTAEEIGFAQEELLGAGALDVFAVPVYMKKNRPGIMLTVLCGPDEKERFLKLIFRHTTTLGVRWTEKQRAVLSRESRRIDTPFGEMTEKTAEGYGVRRAKVEYEDLGRAARNAGISLREVQRQAEGGSAEQ